MTISFNSIPATVRVPFVTAEFDNSRAVQGPALLAYRSLLIGQKTSGTGTANALYKVTSADQVLTLAGVGSQLHRMALAYFANNKFTETWIGILADHGSGVQATGTLTVTVTTAVAGTLQVYIGGQVVSVAVTAGMAQNAIAAAINAAINAATTLGVTSSVSTNAVTVTAKNAGTAGNAIDMRLNYQDGDATPGGVSVAIVAMANGATNPVLTTLIAALGDVWYNVIAHPYTDATNLSAIEAEMVSRYGPMRMIDGVAVTSAVGTQSTLGTLGLTRNCPHSVIASQPGKSPVTPPAEFAAAVAGVMAFYSAIDPARPLQTLAVLGVLPPAAADMFTFAERDLNLHDGIATSKVVGGRVQLERMITTYQTNAAGSPDTSYLDVTTMLTLMYLRYSFRVQMANKYPRSKLANDGTRIAPGQAIITPKIGKAEAILWFRQMEDLGLVEGFDQFKRDLIVERNVSDPNRLDFLIPPDLINGLMVTAAKIQFLL